MIFSQSEFNKWFNDGNALKISKGYIEQTTQWKKVFSYNELKEFYIKEFLTNK